MYCTCTCTCRSFESKEGGSELEGRWGNLKEGGRESDSVCRKELCRPVWSSTGSPHPPSPGDLVHTCTCMWGACTVHVHAGLVGARV